MIPIDMLPDESLLSIFDFYVGFHANEDHPTKRGTEKWQTLVHVCRRWRSIVFGSPRRLNLQLFCRRRTPAKVTLDVWPALPILIERHFFGASPGAHDIIAALNHNDRVCRIELWNFSRSQLEAFLPVMLVPFPELTVLQFGSYNIGSVPVFPDSFLGGFAPRLRNLQMDCIPFPGLPKLLLSASHLVHLHLFGIPPPGYISPEEMVTCLSVLTNLESLWLQFSGHHFPPIQSNRPQKRSTLPAITCFMFRGLCEYLEDLMARIDTPRLNELFIDFFNKIDIPQLTHFIDRTLTLETSHVTFPSRLL